MNLWVRWRGKEVWSREKRYKRLLRVERGGEKVSGAVPLELVIISSFSM